MQDGYNWFEEWFNTPYYHILYKNRDDKEAHAFLDNLIRFLAPPPASLFLDLACGKGRHSLYLHNKGFNVCGVDLSDESIKEASRFAEPGLEFIRHDMREILPGRKFDYTLNLFTSFGYFEDPADNLKTLCSIHANLNEGAYFIFDFFNTYKVMKELVASENLERDGIFFRIKRWMADGYIFKNISLIAADKECSFTEKVEALTLEKMEELLVGAGFEIEHIFGSYQLDTYHHNNSERLILISRRI